MPITRKDAALGTKVGLALIANTGMGEAVANKPYRSWGHAAILIRIDGVVTQIFGWRPVGDVDMGGPAVEGKWHDDSAMLDDEDALSVEFKATLDYTTILSTCLTNEASNKKWKYHFLPKADGKNCVEAALNILIMEQPLDAVKAGAEKIKADIEKLLGKDGLEGLGYSIQVAIMAAKGEI
jgi:hypothetical protein